MGCGQSSGLPIFTQTKPSPIAVTAVDGKVGSVVHVVGFVKSADKLIRAPFSGEPCVACYVSGFLPKKINAAAASPAAAFGNAAGMDTFDGPKSFTARACVPFTLIDGSDGASITVACELAFPDTPAVSKAIPWKLRPQTKHEIFDVMWAPASEEPAMIGHVGGHQGQSDQSQPFADSNDFWDLLTGHKDRRNEMFQKGNPKAGGHTLALKEGVIIAGERVAVVGTLAKREDGTFAIEAYTGQGQGAITNQAHLAPSLKVKSGQYEPTASGGGDEPEIVPITSLVPRG